MTLSLFNTLTKRKEAFEPLEPGKVSMYNCGPTVYEYAHIGNMRSFLLADVLRRALEARGYRVLQVMNITDVGHMTVDDIRDTGEDKMAVAARRFGGDPWKVAEFYMAAFFEDVRALNMLEATDYPRATDFIPQMIELTELLIEADHAYEVNGNVYFDVHSFPAYGRLSGNSVADLEAGARIEVNEEKRHPADFALWKQDDKHIMKWDSPWGEGYPGWHLECSAMGMSRLGRTLDIHTGGEDNVFPHHELEIAQSEGASGQPFVRYWIHGRHLLVDGEKMSKSEGNFYTIRDLLERGYDPMAIRFVLISVQHTQQMNFTLAGLDEAAKNLERVRELVRKLEPSEDVADRPEVGEAVATAVREFDDAIDDDLNISVARAALLGLVTDVNRVGLPLSAADTQAVREGLASMDAVLGLRLLETASEESLDDEVERLIAERLEARSQKDFATSDRIRDELAARGILLTDTPEGTTWRQRS